MDFTVLIGLFFEGLLAFLSPCVLPLIPLYMGYLGINQKEKTKSTFLISICFILGVSMIFFIMGLGINSIKKFILDYKMYIMAIGSIILIVFGLMNLGIFKFKLKKEFHLKSFKTKNVYLNAFLLGFVFSFAWTPCIGPYLSNVIILASSTSNFIGNIYILTYAIGFMIPFVILGLFTDFALNLIKKHMNIVSITTKIGGVIILIMGLYMGKNAYDEYQIYRTNNNQEVEETIDENRIAAYKFTLYDQYDIKHQSKDYLGKPLILQFSTSWCKYCKQMLPVLEKYANNHYVNVLLIMAPGSYNELSLDEMKEFIKINNINVTTLMDVDYEMFSYYGIRSYPTTFYIDKNGYIDGYTEGYLDSNGLDSVFEQIEINNKNRKEDD